MKGFYTEYGYLAKVDNRWILFATEQEAAEYLEES